MSCLEKIMEKIYEKNIIREYLKEERYGKALRELQDQIFLTRYSKGELVISPFQREELFQIVVKGSLNIYFIRDDGTVHSLSSGQENYTIGEMELFSYRNENIYAEATEELMCLSLQIEKNRSRLLENHMFLQLVCRSLASKMDAITAIDAAPASLKERVLTYMRYKCDGGILKGLGQAAFHLNCSVRQLQRIMNQYEEQKIVEKTGKGTYKLIHTLKKTCLNRKISV